MRRPPLAVLTAAAALCLSTIALAPSAGAAPSATALSARNVPVCGPPAAGDVQCHAVRHERLDGNGQVQPNLTPSGYGPADIRSAYNLTSLAGGTVAIVDAYHDPYAESDLAVYRKQFGLPDCTKANGCFTQMNQKGSTTSFPRANAGWSQEISLDLDMVSAACPGCKIVLVEASSASFADLAAAVTTAAAQPGVVAISNSYGGSDTSDSAYSSAYNHPGMAVTASTGDSGYGAQSPATFGGVVAVGGTSLYVDKTVSRGWTEKAWSGAGSGCSTYNAKPRYQTAVTQCGKKADADVSAVADPNTGVAVYDSYAYQGAKGWLVFGGTSASSPIVASVYAQATTAYSGDAGELPWTHASALNDVTTGSNGTCSTPVWCTAGTGWDGPTGLGTPNGTAAF